MLFLKKKLHLITIIRPTANQQQTEYTPENVMFKIGEWLGSRLGMGTCLRNEVAAAKLLI